MLRKAKIEQGYLPRLKNRKEFIYFSIISPTMDESLLKKMPFGDILTAIIYLKPNRTSLFIDEALAYGVRSVFKENRDFSWLFHRQSSSGSCGATHN